MTSIWGIFFFMSWAYNVCYSNVYGSSEQDFSIKFSRNYLGWKIKSGVNVW